MLDHKQLAKEIYNKGNQTEIQQMLWGTNQ